MGRKGCIRGLISGCFVLLVLCFAVCFFAYNWFQYQKAEAERNNISLTTQIARSFQNINDPPPKYDEIKRENGKTEEKKDVK